MAERQSRRGAGVGRKQTGGPQTSSHAGTAAVVLAVSHGPTRQGRQTGSEFRFGEH